MVTQLLEVLQSSMIEDGIISDSWKNALTPISYKSLVIEKFGEKATAYFIKVIIIIECNYLS